MKIYVLTWREDWEEGYPFENSCAFLTKEKALKAEEKYEFECDTYIYEIEVEE